MFLIKTQTAPFPRGVDLKNLAWPEIAALHEKNGELLLLSLRATEQNDANFPVTVTP
jgi:hypothetical protein